MPGETRRQAVVFVIWFSFLLLAVIVGSAVGTHVPEGVSDARVEREELSRSRFARAEVALGIGFVAPLLATLFVTHRRRRGGPHARGITLEITNEGELRLWGRGYGMRVELAGARVDERLVDLYAGRLGAWRERRLTISSGARTIIVGTLATEEDEGFTLQGGEGDCVEFERADFLRMRERIVESTKAEVA